MVDSPPPTVTQSDSPDASVATEVAAPVEAAAPIEAAAPVEAAAPPAILVSRRQQAQDVARGLEESGYQVHAVDLMNDVQRARDALTVLRPHLVWNLVEQIRGDTTLQAALAGYLDLLEASGIGAPPSSLQTCQDRVRQHILLQQAGVPVPGFAIIRDLNAIPDCTGLSAPWIVTQAFDDVYLEEGRTHALTSQRALVDRSASLYPEYSLPYLVEEYLDGRRLHAVVVGDRTLEVLPLVEPDTAGKPGSYRLAQLERDVVDRVRDLAMRAFRVMECRDAAQIDLHLDASGLPRVVDVRPMPELGPGSPLWTAATYHDIGPTQVLAQVVEDAWSRVRVERPDPETPAAAPAASSEGLQPAADADDADADDADAPATASDGAEESGTAVAGSHSSADQEAPTSS